ncbi:Ferric iron ABC transporter, permease protein [Pseudonocardia sp. Ae168_Ps1]|uniref:ABC transporter permease n=1 Tax=unclassified Pseudonocardia TaxID=2619320 RepID=UPI00096730EC|nr:MULTISPECIES: iron ABC transporter permease [unclassified Pseudonocardia]OLL72300.1 Ferric iron ABC transporter, permease protein [Pseudonocardia sp. Ae150A_Ps1]OLL78271.1 Ferric iron ABC transporter, permease protein [Pseudonocardia sp. Ae168_Ps1]OLL87602.1 Ferric iron ABC transporter, permease protein [Pseudonocardia sp. Ae263_Ps1]OLL92369.1 Ferric iron ABC transporter, permease protein [Pseudonocardia sp. Ae356_Ps1]
MAILQEPPRTGTGETAAPPPRARIGRRRRRLPTVLVLVVLAVLIVLPAAMVLLAAFSVDVPRPGNITWDLTLGNFGVFTDPQTLTAFGNSMVIGVVSTALACLIGGSLAFLAARSDIPVPRFVYLVGLMPIFLPSYVGALAWSMLGGPNAGLLNIAQADLGLSLPVDMYSVPGMIVVFAMYYSPYTFLLVHGAMSMMSPDLEEAARVHGATSRRMLGLVSFPLATPALIGSAMLTFILVFENFPVAQILGTPGGVDTLPTLIFRLLNTSPSRGNESAAIAVVLVAVVLLATWLQQRMLAKRSFTTVTGKGIRQKKVALGRARIPALVAVLGFFALSIVLPVLALVTVAGQSSPYLTSLTQLAEPGGLDFSSFSDVLVSSSFQEAAWHSLVVSVFAASAGVVLAFLCGYLVYRTRATGRSLVEGISMIPLALPAVVLGMGLLWTWLVMPVPLYGTLAVLVIAFLAVQSPQGFRGVASSILATDRDLEDSAVMLGAHRARAVTSVTVPLMKVGLLSTFLLLLMLSMRELTVPLFLYTSDTEILSIAIYDAFENGGALREAAAMSVIYTAFMFVLSYIPRRLAR